MGVRQPVCGRVFLEGAVIPWLAGAPRKACLPPSQSHFHRFRLVARRRLMAAFSTRAGRSETFVMLVVGGVMWCSTMALRFRATPPGSRSW